MGRTLAIIAAGLTVCVTAATFSARAVERRWFLGPRIAGNEAEPTAHASRGRELPTSEHAGRGREVHGSSRAAAESGRREPSARHSEGVVSAPRADPRHVGSTTLASTVVDPPDRTPLRTAAQPTIVESIDPCDTPVAVLDSLGRIARPTYSGDRSGRAVALTFDDGPSAENTPSILHTLRHKDVPATFFLLGERVTKMPELTASIAEDGHELANHTWSHESLASMFKSQLQAEVCRTAAAIEAVSGRRPTRFRPPFGRVPDSSLPVLGGLGQQVVLWSVDGHDWTHDDPEALARAVVRGAHPGAIILLHDREPLTARALPSIIGGLRARGFEIVPLASLVGTDD